MAPKKFEKLVLSSLLLPPTLQTFFTASTLL